MPTFSYNGTGGIIIDGLAKCKLVATTTVDVSFLWKLPGMVGVSKPFQWAVGDPPLTWYKVNGKCVGGTNGGPTCQNSGLSTDPKCPSQPFAFVLARSPADLCAQLTAQGWKFPVSTIQQYSKPAETSVVKAQQAKGIDNSCQVLTNVPFDQIPQCLNFTIDFDLVVNGAMKATGDYLVVYKYIAGGTIHLHGSADAFIPPPTCIGSGGITMGGSATFRSGHFSYTPDGSEDDIVLGGASTFVSSSWTYPGEGGIILGGGGRFSSSSWTYYAEGGIVLGGDVSNRQNYEFVSDGNAGPELAGINIGGRGKISGQNYSYKYTGSGGIVLGGDAIVRSSAFSCVGSGGIVLGGDASWKSSRFVYQTTGGVTLGGSFATIYPTVYGSGGITMDGSCTTVNNYQYFGQGGIVLGGSPFVVSPYWKYDGQGGIVLNGSAYTRNNFFGTLLIMGAVDVEMTDLGVDFAEEDAEVTLTAPTDVRVTNLCNCPSLSLVLNMTHNLADVGHLTEFLRRNGLSIPTTLKMYYDGVNAVWRSNLHLRATGDPETWTIVAEWSCADSLGGDDLGSPSWVYSLLLKRNLGKAQTFDARLLVAFSTEGICLDPSVFKFAFQVNTTKNLVVVKPQIIIDTEILYDNIGVFRSSSWLADPVLSINITDNPPQALGDMYDLTPFTTETQPPI